MSTIDDRAAGIRGKLQERSGGIRSELTSRRQALAQGLIRDLSQIITRQTEPPTLRREEPRGGIPSARGYAQYNYQPGSSTGGGGIASPLVEADFSAREWWPLGIPSTDGLLYFPAPKKITMTDANGAEVVLEYAEP